MSIKRKSQQQLLLFIADVMSKVEKDKFQVRLMRTTNRVYKEFGHPLLEGNLCIIGNSAYLKKIREEYMKKPNKFLKGNFRYKLRAFRKMMDDTHRGIIFEFTDTPLAQPYDFTRIISTKSDDFQYIDIISENWSESDKKIPLSVKKEFVANDIKDSQNIQNPQTGQKKQKRKTLKILNGEKVLI